MKFGGTLDRTLTLTRHADPRYGPPFLDKHDVDNGFYRMQLEPEACLALAILPPHCADEPELIAIPMSIAMGWVQSPATFCTMSETVCNLANGRFKAKLPAPDHWLETLCSTQSLPFLAATRPGGRRSHGQPGLGRRSGGHQLGPPNMDRHQLGPPNMDPNERAPPSNLPHKGPLGHTDVFVDDFIQIGQGGTKRMRTLRNHLLAAVDNVLAQPQPGDNWNETMSLKKLLKGDGSWSTRKVILGWIIDTVRQTIKLPPHRKLERAQIFTDLANSSRISHKKFQRILG